MDPQVVGVYGICDDLLKGMHHTEDKQRQRSDAEVLTTLIVAGLFFSGNQERSRVFLQEHGYIPNMLEKSRFNRRQHKIAELFLVVFDLLGDCWKQLNEQSVYVTISACDNYRISRCQLYQDEE